MIQKAIQLFREKLTAYQWYLGIRFLGTFLAGIILSKSGYLTADIGRYESFLLMASGSSFFWLAGLFNGYLIKRGKLDAASQQVLYFQTLLLNIVFTIISGAVLLLLSPLAVQSSEITILLLLYLAGNNLAFTLEYHFLTQNRQFALLMWGMLPMMIQAILFLLMAAHALPVIHFIQAVAALAALRGLTALAWTLRVSKWSLDGALLKAQILISAPIALSVLAAGSSEYIDAFLARHFFGDEGLAILRYGARELPFVLIPANALSVSMLHIISENQKQGIIELRSKASFLFKLAAPVCILLLLSSKWIYPIVFNASFIASAPIFNVFCLLALTRLIFPQTVLSAAGKTNWILVISVLEILCNFIFSLLLLEHFGLIGIAWGTILTAILENGLLMLFVKRTLGLSPATYIDIRTHAAWGVAIVAAYCITLLY